MGEVIGLSGQVVGRFFRAWLGYMFRLAERIVYATKNITLQGGKHRHTHKNMCTYTHYVWGTYIRSNTKLSYSTHNYEYHIK